MTHGILGMRVAILKSTYAGAKQQAIIAAIQNVTSFATPAVASMSCCNLEGVKIIMQQMLSIIFEWVLIYMEIFYIVWVALSQVSNAFSNTIATRNEKLSYNVNINISV